MTRQPSRTRAFMNQADTMNTPDVSRPTSRSLNQCEHPTAWLSNFQNKFESISRACSEVALGFKHLREAIDDMQGIQPPNISNLLEEAMGIPPRGQATEASPFQGPPPFSSFAQGPSNDTSTNQKYNGGTSPIPQNSVKVETESASMPASPSVTTSSQDSNMYEVTVWSERKRRELNEEFIRYFERRRKTGPVTHRVIADELLKYCSTPPPLGHLDKQVGRYLRRHTIPKDPLVLGAIQEWIEAEISESGELFSA